MSLKLAWHEAGASVDADGDRDTVQVGVVESINDPVRLGKVALSPAQAEAMGHTLIAAARIARQNPLAAHYVPEMVE